MQDRFQHTFTKSKMNKDLDARLIAPDEYRDGINISVSRAEADDVGALENILGNSLFTQLNSSSPFLMQTIGWYFNPDNDKVYIFDTNFQDSTGDQISNFASVNSTCRILVGDIKAQTIQTIVNGRFLNFSWNSPILDIVILEDLMFWTDDRNQPRVININTAEADNTYYYNEDHISVVKYYPHKPISLSNEYKAPSAAFVSKSFMDTNSNANWQSYYSHFVLDTTTSDPALITALTNNIGMQGYIKGTDNTLWEFKVAYVMVDPNNASGTPMQITSGGTVFSPLTLVFIDRELSTAIPTSETPAFQDYNLTFIQGTSLDVSSPWLREDQVKLTIRNFDAPNSMVRYSDINPGTYMAAQSLYAFGTRGPYQYYKGATGGAIVPPFQLPNHFPENQGSAATGLCRVTHPKLNPQKYYCISYVTDPTVTNGHGFQISELTNIINGQLILQANPSDLLSTGDVLTIHWPNKDYKYTFPGDPTFLEDKFVRFAYRFKYDDGQYSLISPYTQSIFVPKQKGYFLKKVGRQKSTGSSLNNYVPEENTAGQTTITDFMKNEITQVNLNINCEYTINELANALKVSEIDIIYKESDSTTLKIIDSIEITDLSVTSNTTKTYSYTYQSKKPIKTLRSDEITRVYDVAPVRAKTLSSAGNRIIYGNYYDRHTSPSGLSFFAAANSKLTPATTTQVKSSDGGIQFDRSPFIPNSFSTVSYPNHSLKQNRSYQVGLILQDRYGRSSDVILSSFSEINFTLATGGFAEDPLVFFGSTVYNPYLSSVIAPLTPAGDITKSNKIYSGLINWPGDSLKILFAEQVPSSISYAQGYPGLYEDPFVTTKTTKAVSQNNDSRIFIDAGGLNNNIKPGMLISWKETVVGAPGEGTIQQAYVGQIEGTAAFRILAIVKPNGLPFTGTNMTTVSSLFNLDTVIDFIQSDQPLGWYSYKVVVKQEQQDYYNVYLPSLLDGLPIIKPFKLDCTFVTGSNVVKVDPIGDLEYLTFPLLEGMKVVAGANTYFISNILNYSQFEISTPAVTGYTAEPAPIKNFENSFEEPEQSTMDVGINYNVVPTVVTGNGSGATINVDIVLDGALKELKLSLGATGNGGTNYKTGDHLKLPANPAPGVKYPEIDIFIISSNLNSRETEFSTEASNGVINTTTLITDNANKVPPALIETSPVQQNYSTSDTELIPRAAFSNDWTTPAVTADFPYTSTNTSAIAIFPGNSTGARVSKVQSIGNFEALFRRGSYFGLYNADTDPPAAIIKNNFNIGQNAQTAKSSSQAETIAAIYETTPVISSLDIYYETSTSGTILSLNQLVRDNLAVPQLLVQYTGVAGSTGSNGIGTVSVLESLNFSSTPTIKKFQILDSAGDLVTYLLAKEFGISTALYGDGTTVGASAPYTVTESADSTERGDSVYLLKTTSTNPFYSGVNTQQNIINFNVSFKFLQFAIVPIQYSIPISTVIQNVIPARVNAFVSTPTTVYYFYQGAGVDPTPEVVPLITPATPSTWTNQNGTNTSLSEATNGSFASNVNFGQELSWSLHVDTSGGTNYVNVTANPIANLGISLSTSGVANAATQRVLELGTFGGSFNAQTMSVEIRVTDQNGTGLTKTVSQFQINVRVQPVFLRKYRATVGSPVYPQIPLFAMTNFLYNGGKFPNTPLPNPLPPSGAQNGNVQGLVARMDTSTGDMTVITPPTSFNVGDIIGAASFGGSQPNALFTLQLTP